MLCLINLNIAKTGVELSIVPKFGYLFSCIAAVSRDSVLETQYMAYIFKMVLVFLIERKRQDLDGESTMQVLLCV